MSPWEKWIPTRKVTAGTFSAAAAFVGIWLGAKVIEITPAEAVVLGGALTLVVAYWIPERKNGDG